VRLYNFGKDGSRTKQLLTKYMTLQDKKRRTKSNKRAKNKRKMRNKYRHDDLKML
jgi:hypothetical protein